MEGIMRVEGGTRSYRRDSGTIHALDRFGRAIEEGSFWALMGPAGSGKTTLLNMIGGLDRPDSGSIEVAGEDISRMTPAQLARWRADTIGFVFQGFNLLPVLTAIENV